MAIMIVTITVFITLEALPQYSNRPVFAQEGECHEQYTGMFNSCIQECNVFMLGEDATQYYTCQEQCDVPEEGGKTYVLRPGGEPMGLNTCSTCVPGYGGDCPTAPEPPEANAGEDQKVTKKDQVIQLDGGGSKGQELKYNWIMKEGPSSVVLDNPQSPNPTFVFPTSEEFKPGSFERKVVFQLEVTNELGTETDTVEIKDSCFVEEKPFKTYNSGPWSFKYGIVEKEGLVLKDIRAGREQLFDSISIPHFKIVDSAGNDQIIRFCDPSSSGYYSFYPEIEEPVATGDGISNLYWGFTVDFDNADDEDTSNNQGIEGQLNIMYDIAIVSKELDNCELTGYECYRFVPKVSYDWYSPNSPPSPNQKDSELPPLKRFAAFYKLDYGSDTGLARVKDVDTFGSSVNEAGDKPMITHETAFLAVKNGQPGDSDNIHTAHSNQGIFVPGCRFFAEFDCVHMHWKWPEFKYPKSADPMVEPSTGEPLSGVSPGTPNLVPDQTIAIAIVKDNPGEEDPDDIPTLLNNEQIASARAAAAGKLTPGMPDIEFCKNCVLVKGGDPIVWYVASVSDKIKDTFFRHGFFVLDTDPTTADRNQIRGSLQQDYINQNGENVQSELKGVDEASDSSSSPTESSSIPTSLPTNSLPIVSSQTVSTNGNTPVEIMLSASDSDVNDDLIASIVTPPSNGTLGDIDQTTGIVMYTPNPDSNGNDAFGFKVNDGNADSSNVGIVEIVMNKSMPLSLSSSPSSPSTPTIQSSSNMNTPPAGQDQLLETKTSSSMEITLAAKDPNENDELTAAITVPPLHGKLSDINQLTGILTYTPEAGYTGLDRFSFKVNDGKEDSTNEAVVMITVS